MVIPPSCILIIFNLSKLVLISNILIFCKGVLQFSILFKSSPINLFGVHFSKLFNKKYLLKFGIFFIIFFAFINSSHSLFASLFSKSLLIPLYLVSLFLQRRAGLNVHPYAPEPITLPPILYFVFI